MRCQRGGRAAVLFVTLTTLLVVGGTAAVAAPRDNNGDDGKGGRDVAIPAPDAEAQLAGAGVAPGTGAVGAPAATRRLDDFRYDRLLTEGYARDVCYGRLRPGTAMTFNELQQRFGGSAGTLYACRERWNAAEEPDCNGTLVSPTTSPDFFSTCWSNHAQGRALDLMSTKARGDAVVNWLLAPDRRGRYSAMARRLGVQQILWWDHCWNTDDDRGVLSVKGMRKCGIDHFDHIHIDLTFRGSMGRTSYWGGTPVVTRKMNGAMWWDSDTGEWRTQRWFNYRPTPRRSSTWGAQWDQAVPGDFDKDRVVDDMLLWDRDTGRWSLQAWVRHRRRTVRAGTFLPIWDQLVAGDFDGNRRRNDLLLWDKATGQWAVRSFFPNGSRVRNGGVWPANFDQVFVGDLDEDNRLDDMFLQARDTGGFQVISWNQFTPTVVRTGKWAPRFSQFVIGDWDSDGELNDMLARDPRSGEWKMVRWHDFRNRRRGTGTWLPRYKRIVAADLDAEGRVDDMLIRSPRTGQWKVVEWHYYRSHRRYRSTYLRRWDQVIVGAWG